MHKITGRCKDQQLYTWTINKKAHFTGLECDGGNRAEQQLTYQKSDPIELFYLTEWRNTALSSCIHCTLKCGAMLRLLQACACLAQMQVSACMSSRPVIDSAIDYGN